MVAVSPAVNRSLNEASFASQARVELCQRPADRVTLSLVMQTVAFVLVLGAACAGVNAVLRLEVLGKFFDIDGLDVATDGVLHLDAVTRVLESNPLDPILVLADD